MIKSLHIENIAVIEKTDIDFGEGLNVLTGETGAGKSIIIDAINAVLGERTSKELIRSGCDRAEVSALFCDLSDTSKQALIDNGYEVDEDGSLLIVRVLSLAGNGTIKINGRPATAGVLRAIGKNLVNIHGQHDNQSLLNPDNHYLYLDRLAENSNVLQEYYDEFRYLNAVRRELASLEIDEDEKKRKTELLEYQIKELEAADIKLGELDDIKSKLQIAENYEKTMSALSDAYYSINGTDDADGAFSMLKNAQKHVAAAKGDEFPRIAQRLGDLLAELDDIAADIRGFTHNAEYSELDAEKLRSRLDTLHRLMLKYGSDEQSCLDFLEKSRRELDNISISEEKISELSQELDHSTERLVALGEKLTATRVKAASECSKKVCEVLNFLDMPNVVFDVKIEKGRYTKVGCDTVEFMIGTNAGESVKPLHKIASGGELSRVMLSIKSIFADKDDVDTLIFDEIDTGISGRAAGKVGVQLKNVAECRQVVCVTHLAQIAAFAQNHLLIEKAVQNGRTYTGVKSLSYDDRISELARIMSGTDMTENFYNSAKELLDRSNI